MRKRLIVKIVIICVLQMVLLSTGISLAQEYDSNALPREQRMSWWEEARFGMFIHWGLYSIPAGVWEGKQIEELGEWIMAYADIPVDEYQKLPNQFNPSDFDPKAWVRMAKNAGMKYLVITTRHHDGFCLFDTKHTDWNVVDSSPYRRDIIKEISVACKEEGIRFCAYYSILEWKHPAMELNTNFDDLEPFSDQAHEGGAFTHIDSTWRKYGNVRVKEDQKDDFVAYMKSQLKELIEQYDPGIIWFDGGWVDWWSPGDGKDLLTYLWDLNPKLIVNNRAAEDFDKDIWYGDYGTPEQTIPPQGLDYRWESCMTMNSTWGYKIHDQNWKPARLLITQLVDVISKGGNFLLNVGPRANGSFPRESIDRLKEIAEWMQVNGESVHGTENWRVYQQGRHDMEESLYDIPDVSSVILPFTWKDIRFTRKDNIVYAFCLDWPEGEVWFKSLGYGKYPGLQIQDVSMMGSSEAIFWEQKRKGLVVSVPNQKPCNYVYVYKITISEPK